MALLEELSMFYPFWDDEEYRSLYRGLRYIEFVISGLQTKNSSNVLRISIFPFRSY